MHMGMNEAATKFHLIDPQLRTKPLHNLFVHVLGEIQP
jgi:hypothetical protein